MADTDLRAQIAGRLRVAREAAGLSQGQVARMLDMHRPTITEIEAGRRRVSAEELAQFANTYGTSVEWLLESNLDEGSTRDQKIKLAARELGSLRDDDLDGLLRLLRMLRDSGGKPS